MPRKKVEKVVEVEPEVQAEPEAKTADLILHIKKYFLFYLCCFLSVLLLVMIVLYVTKGSDPVPAVSPDISSLDAEEQIEVSTELVEAVSSIMVLPDDSVPLIATVTDAATLRAEQSFYQKVEDGDVLMIFQDSRQAVIYRPSANKIVNAGPLIVDQDG